MNANAEHVIALIDDAIADWEVGPDAMRWAPAPAAPLDVRVGDVVDYHGSITYCHGLYVVVGVDGGRLSLRDYAMPEERLSRVRLASVTPTGEWMPVCRCNHPHVHPLDGPTGRCPRVGCECPHHP